MDGTIGESGTETTDSALEYLKNNHEDATEENGLEKLVFKHNDSVKLKSYQKLQKKQHHRRSHKKGSHVVDGKHAECESSATECRTQETDAEHSTEEAATQGKKVRYGGETRLRSLSGVAEEDSDDEGCEAQES